MLPSSVRRVATVACQSPPILLSFAPAASAIGLRVAQVSQTRYSSSKASSSDNGPKKVAANDSVTPSVESKSSGEKRKRKPKVAKSPPARALPSVPSTSHLSQQTIALTSFFSLHRPISVTEGFPATVTDDTFASIFAAKPSPSASDVASTLSDTVDQLEQPMTKVVISTKDGGSAGEQQVQIFQQVENALPSLFDQLNTMSGKFSPFMSPPTPRDAGVGEEAVVGEESEQAEMEAQKHEDQHIQYKAVITIDQTTKPDGRVEMVAHSPQILMNPEDEREHRRRTRRWNFISVKRIRKLKMKKKKYKKLMRRTRNDRRKLDRL